MDTHMKWYLANFFHFCRNSNLTTSWYTISYKVGEWTLRLSVTLTTAIVLIQYTASVLEACQDMHVCMYAHPTSAMFTDLVSTFSNLLETWLVAVVEIPTGWCPAVVVTVQDPVVDNISLSLSLHTLHHAVKDGQYCFLSRKGEGPAEFQARVQWSTTVYEGTESKVMSTKLLQTCIILTVFFSLSKSCRLRQEFPSVAVLSNNWRTL